MKMKLWLVGAWSILYLSLPVGKSLNITYVLIYGIPWICSSSTTDVGLQALAHREMLFSVMLIWCIEAVKRLLQKQDVSE